MKLAIVVPVAPFESVKALIDSIEHVRALSRKFDCKVVYVIDRNSEGDERIRIAKSLGVEVIEREGRRGKRAGAINDAVKYLVNYSPDFVLILDIDSRTDEKTISNCISALSNSREAYIASAKRCIYNSSTLISQTIEVEYKLINFLLKKSGFRQFNGLIGLVRFEHLLEGLKEDAIAEDADFATRMHAKGRKALIVDGAFFEQAPLSWKDFYRQRKRWYYGGLQLWRYRKEMAKAERKVRFSWYLALTITYFPLFILLSFPIAVLAIPLYYRKISKLKVAFGMLLYSLVLQFSAISALIDYLRKKEVEWNAIRRA